MYAFITITSCIPTAKCVPLQYYIKSIIMFYKCHVYKYMDNILHGHN
jgi:hypothetical protein